MWLTNENGSIPSLDPTFDFSPFNKWNPFIQQLNFKSSQISCTSIVLVSRGATEKIILLHYLWVQDQNVCRSVCFVVGWEMITMRHIHKLSEAHTQWGSLNKNLVLEMGSWVLIRPTDMSPSLLPCHFCGEVKSGRRTWDLPQKGALFKECSKFPSSNSKEIKWCEREVDIFYCARTSKSNRRWLGIVSSGESFSFNNVRPETRPLEKK